MCVDLWNSARWCCSHVDRDELLRVACKRHVLCSFWCVVVVWVGHSFFAWRGPALELCALRISIVLLMHCGAIIFFVCVPEVVRKIF